MWGGWTQLIPDELRTGVGKKPSIRGLKKRLGDFKNVVSNVIAVRQRDAIEPARNQ